MTDKVEENKPPTHTDPDGEINLGELFSAIWRTRTLVLGAVVISALILAGLLAVLRAAIPTQQIFKQAITFTFQGIEKKKYPNDSKFSLADIIAPFVLNEVYKQNNLSKQGIKLHRFTSSVSIHSYSLNYEAVLNRYRARLSAKKLQFSERQEIEKDMHKELKRLQGKNALLQIRLKKRLGISKNLGRKLLHDIFSTWARLSIEQLGVLKLPEGFENKELINLFQLDNLSQNASINLLMDAVGRCKKQIDILQSFGGGQTISDTQSGHTVSSLMRVMEIFELYPNGLKTDSRLFQNYHRQRIKALQIEKKSVNETAEILRLGLESYTTTTPATSPQDSPKPDPVQPQGSSVMQLDGAFISKVISLAQRTVDQEYRTGLLKKYVLLKKKSIEVDRNIENLKIILASSTVPPKSQNSAVPASSGSKEKDRQRGIRYSAEKLNNLWQIAGRLFSQLGTKRLSLNKNLYTNLELPSSQYASSYHPLLNKKTAWIYFSALFAIGIFTSIAGVLWQALRNRTKI